MSEEKNVSEAEIENNKPKQKGGCLKGCLTIFVVFIIFGALIGACFGDEESVDEDKVKEEEEITTSTKENNTEKQTEAEKTKEIEFYNNELSPALDSVQKEYDRIWNDLWVKTFNGVSDGSVDVYTAYKNMTFVETNYRVLEDTIKAIEGKGLSKTNKEHLDEFKEKLEKAASYRAFAATEAAEMFDKGEFKPSELDNIKSIVAVGDGEMMNAVISRTMIEDDLGLLKTTEQ